MFVGVRGGADERTEVQEGIGREEAGGGCPLHEGDGEVGADEVAREDEARVGGGDGGAVVVRSPPAADESLTQVVTGFQPGR